MAEGNAPGTLRWLHISDFHLREAVPYDRDVVLKALLTSIPSLVARYGKLDLVFATGDIAYSGLRGEYNHASLFFESLLDAVELTRERLFVIPGNHDVDRRAGKGLARTMATREEADEYFAAPEDLLHVSLRQTEFSKWFDTFFDGVRTFPRDTTCAPPDTIAVNGVSTSVLRINSATFAYDEHDHGKLLIGRPCLDRQLEQLQKPKRDLTVALMHHPLSWLSSLEATNIRTALRASADIILSGHLHENQAEHVATTTDNVLLLAAGATYQSRRYPNTALICTYDAGAVTVAPIIYSDSPREAWIPDASLFANEPTFMGTIPLMRAKGALDAPPPSCRDDEPRSLGANDLSSPAGLVSHASSAKQEFEQDLFRAPNENLLYAEPRLMDRAPEMAADDPEEAKPIAFHELVASQDSFLIETKPEYGGTTLCRRLSHEFAIKRAAAYRKDARDLPSYRAKLETAFPAEARQMGATATLILDHFDVERDERMLHELEKTNWFSRIIAVTVDRSGLASRPLEPAAMPFKPRLIYLWAMSRENVRDLSQTVFASADDVFVSRVVDKVYADLLALCIPLTPANVIMYLRVLFREGDFNPLSRVDIVGRYIFDTLRRPSDLYSETFAAKSKADLLSAFVHALYTNGQSRFEDRSWYDFCGTYQRNTLSDFDARSLLNELIEGRIFARFGGHLYLRYSFFFSYFLGRHLSSRSELARSFVESEEYLRVGEVIDVITGLSSDNSEIVRQLTDKLNSQLSSFSEKYLSSDFDPLLRVPWPVSDQEEEMVWKPVQAAIDAGPAKTTEIDVIKTSLLDEARTSNQEVVLFKFTELEHALFAVDVILADALRNADDISGDLKLSALDSLLRASLVVFQLGTVLAPALAHRRTLTWGGIQFLDFNNFGDKLDPNSPEAFAYIVYCLCYSIGVREAGDIGTYRLAAVFRERAKRSEEIGFLDFLLFHCVLGAKGLGWADTLKTLIERCPRNSYYLFMMLKTLAGDLRREITRSGDRESVKRLIAMIHAKRAHSKQAPGSKLVTKMLADLERRKMFETEKAPGKDDEAPPADG
jgi:predicted phosphodiesterase